jgi:TonB family protein
MTGRSEIPLLWLTPVLMILTAPTVVAQRPTSPLPSGNRIVAQDGDVVVADNDARIRIVRRREAYVRVVFNAAERWLVVLVDHATSAEPADGRVDRTYHYREVGGAWPFDARWEGAATIEEYSMAPPGRSSGSLGITTPQGLVQLLGLEKEFRDRNAVAVLSFRGAGNGGGMQLGFDESESREMAQVRRNDGVTELPSGGGASGKLTLQAGVSGAPAGDIQVEPSGAVRVGGRVRPPVKIVDVPPVLPDLAAGLGIRGIVIVEVIVDVDGTVKDARVLRSIPMLDAAALDTVRQWRYEPTTVDGKSVPVVMTVSVSF